MGRPARSLIMARRAETALLATVETGNKTLILATLRDVLLPKPIAGHLRVKDAEAFLQRRL